VKQVALAVTNPQDWVDQDGRPYLQASGGEKVARLFGISWRIEEPTVERDSDGHYTYTYKGTFALQSGIEIEAIGTRSSRDKFFTTRYEGKGDDRQRIELTPVLVDRGDVKKSAYTNLLANGITRLLGLRNLTWDEVEAHTGIKRGDAATVSRQKVPMAAPAMLQRDEILRMLLEMASGDGDKAAGLLEQATSFTGKDGRAVAGKRNLGAVSEKAMAPTYKRVKELYAAWREQQFEQETTTEAEATEQGAETALGEVGADEAPLDRLTTTSAEIAQMPMCPRSADWPDFYSEAILQMGYPDVAAVLAVLKENYGSGERAKAAGMTKMWKGLWERRPR